MPHFDVEMHPDDSAASTVARPYRAGSDDWWRIRRLLVETHALVTPGWNWDVRRWDGWRFHREAELTDDELAGLIHLWETREGRLLAVVHPEGPGEAFLEVRPEARHLEPAMIRWAEAHLARAADGGRGRHLGLSVFDDDAPRRALLRQLGFRELDSGGWFRWLRFEVIGPVADQALPAPYVLGTAGPADADCARLAALLNASFGRSSHSALEYRTFVERSPSFEAGLNLVAVAPDGSFAAHVGVTIDAVNRHAVFEPVCTHPDHRRHGLARLLMLEGLRLLQGRGAATASVDTGDGEAANALYIAVGFVEGHHAHQWEREA